MTAQRLTMVFAGLFVVASLSLSSAQMGIDLTQPSWMWFTLFVGVNLMIAGVTGFCLMTRILHRLGLK